MPRAGLSAAAVVARAGELADARGLSELSLATLADDLGVRAPSLYKHVGGLADLHRRLALSGLRDLGDVLISAETGGSGGQALAALGQAYRKYAHEHPGRYAAANRAPDPDDREGADAGRRVTDVLMAVLRGYGVSGDDLVHATRAVRSALHGFVALEDVGGFGLPVDVEVSFAALLTMLDRGLRAAAA